MHYIFTDEVFLVDIFNANFYSNVLSTMGKLTRFTLGIVLLSFLFFAYQFFSVRKIDSSVGNFNHEHDTI